MQNVDNRTVIYLADPKQPGRFIEREVQLGDQTGTDVDVVSGVNVGDTVASDGSFFLRAERDRLGLRPATRPQGSAASAPALRPLLLAPDRLESAGNHSPLALAHLHRRFAALVLRAPLPLPARPAKPPPQTRSLLRLRL